MEIAVAERPALGGGVVVDASQLFRGDVVRMLPAYAQRNSQCSDHCCLGRGMGTPAPRIGDVLCSYPFRGMHGGGHLRVSSMSPSKDHFSARARSTTGQNEGGIGPCGVLRLWFFMIHVVR